MDPAIERALFERLRRNEEPRTDTSVLVEAYTSPARFAAERALLRREPLVAGHASQLPQIGDYLTRDLAGVPVLVVRTQSGRMQAFVNACRHRGTRLVDDACGHAARAFVCRYHAWTYALDGALTHLPYPECFPSLDKGSAGLVELPCEVRHGLVWVLLTPGAPLDVRATLGPVLDDELGDLGLDRHHAHRTVVEPRACNWKLVIEAFLEGYHARFLHQKTLARFFSGVVVFDRLGRHARSVGARREDPPSRELRLAATLFYFVFPATVLVLHPECVSLITMMPDAVDRSTYAHTLLVPHAGETWDKTWSLIEETVFQKEDLRVAESIQTTLSSGLEQRFHIGALELLIRHFHDALAEG